MVKKVSVVISKLERVLITSRKCAAADAASTPKAQLYRVVPIPVFKNWQYYKERAFIPMSFTTHSVALPIRTCLPSPCPTTTLTTPEVRARAFAKKRRCSRPSESAEAKPNAYPRKFCMELNFKSLPHATMARSVWRTPAMPNKSTSCQFPPRSPVVDIGFTSGDGSD
jgi:hypothetical protein